MGRYTTTTGVLNKLNGGKKMIKKEAAIMSTLKTITFHTLSFSNFQSRYIYIRYKIK